MGKGRRFHGKAVNYVTFCGRRGLVGIAVGEEMAEKGDEGEDQQEKYTKDKWHDM